MEATPTINNIPLRAGDFSTLPEALNYAAQGQTGYNFYDGRGKLSAVLPFSKLRDEAQSLAQRLSGLGLERGARMALVADTHPDFMRFFFACQYAGLVPVPLPASIHMGGRKTFVDQLHRLLISCRANVAMATEDFFPFLSEAAEGLDLRFCGTPQAFDELPEASIPLSPLGPKELAYIQYTSGSTKFPRGVMITQTAVLNNLAAIVKSGSKTRPGDRAASWLPFYHDMGLVGLVLAPLAAQVSVDYLKTRDFAMRPRLWLALMTENRATISIGPPFGYELCLQRLRQSDIEKFDLSAWRLAGVGAETIRPAPLFKFAEMLEPCGFKKEAFCACYGMAECSLAVSFAPLSEGLNIDSVDGDYLSEHRQALPVESDKFEGAVRSSRFVDCGAPLADYEVEVRDAGGRALPERHVGTIYVKADSIMSGYFGDLKLTQEVLTSDGWFNTGDLGYFVKNGLFITGREKDMIIINGRNIWPQDLEFAAEQQPEIRTGDASAFSVPGPDGLEKPVMMVQCRVPSDSQRVELRERIQRLIYQELGIDCYIDLVPRNTLPRTTSGKLSRSKARKEFLKRIKVDQQQSSNRPMFVLGDSAQVG
ncbi:MAG: fatty acyl-AMP ligase [Desulfobacterales bacterium]|nr:fatty acyl-AMP ligase [Desulfobacterales bacterium]